MGEGITYWASHKLRVQFKNCRADPAEGLLAAQS